MIELERWWVILADGREISSEECAAADVPRWPRAVCIAQVGAGARNWKPVLVNGDIYTHRTGDAAGWCDHTERGALNELIDHALETDAVLDGKYVVGPRFKALWARGRELANG